MMFSSAVFTVYASLFSDIVSIGQAFHVSIGNDGNADAVFDGAYGLIVDRLAPLLFGATMHADPSGPTFLCSPAQLHCLPATDKETHYRETFTVV